MTTSDSIDEMWGRVDYMLRRVNGGRSAYWYHGGGPGGTCYECPFASVPLDRGGGVAHDVWNDPTEAYFTCSLETRKNPTAATKPEWGEYAPCEHDEWVRAIHNRLVILSAGKVKMP